MHNILSAILGYVDFVLPGHSNRFFRDLAMNSIKTWCIAVTLPILLAGVALAQDTTVIEAVSSMKMATAFRAHQS